MTSFEFLNHSALSTIYPIIYLMRTVCIHFHIFKNAGHSIEWSLEKYFKKNFAQEAYGSHSGGIIPIQSVIDYLKKNRKIVVFSSHHIRFPIPSEPSLQFIPIIFIRHPIDRAFSEYTFTKRNPYNKGKFSDHAKSMNLKDYVQWNLENKTRLMSNSQLQFLSDDSIKTPSLRLDSAIQRIKTSFLAVRLASAGPIVGIVDRFDESMVLAEEYLKNFFPEIDLSYKKKNISNERKGSLEERLESGRAEIGDELMDQLIKKNQKDFKIFSTVNEQLDIQIRQIEDFEKKLSEFKKRCNNLTQQKKIDFIRGKRLIYSPEKKILVEKKFKKWWEFWK